MEENNNKVTSCLMLAANLSTPISLKSIFDEEDLKDTGIEYDSHITVLYAPEKYLNKTILTQSIAELNPTFLDYLYDHSDADDWSVPVLDLFDLGNFENDSGYVVLKLKKDNMWFNELSKLNKGLMKEFNVESAFKEYTPHLTLAEVNPGATGKYLKSESLRLMLEHSMVHFEDFILSYSEPGVKEYDVHNLTTNCAVDRFFRIRELEKETFEEV